MEYTKDVITEYMKEEDVKFVLLSFIDIKGRMRTTTIMPSELERALTYGISIDGSAIDGFSSDGVHSDLFLHPDISSFTVLPWRPDQGKAVRFFSYVTFPDGREVETDSRYVLKRAVEKARENGLSFFFGTEYEFYLFPLLEDGTPSLTPIDSEGYMASSPLDRGEAIRREICLMLEDLGLHPEVSHHEEGPGQNEIDFSYSDPITAADRGETFCQVVRTVAMRNGLYADFSPRPVENAPGNGLHINISVRGTDGDSLSYMTAGIMKYIREMTLFLNPVEASYRRLGRSKAPKYVSYSYGNRSQLIRIPAAAGPYVRAEVRSPDAECNIYLALALIINAATEGIVDRLEPPFSIDADLYTTEMGSEFLLPRSLEEAKKLASRSAFISRVLPAEVISFYTE